jgi:hypothetical protein
LSENKRHHLEKYKYDLRINFKKKLIISGLSRRLFRSGWQALGTFKPVDEALEFWRYLLVKQKVANLM